MTTTIVTKTPQRSIKRGRIAELEDALVKQAKCAARQSRKLARHQRYIVSMAVSRGKDNREILELALRLDALEDKVRKLTPRKPWAWLMWWRR